MSQERIRLGTVSASYLERRYVSDVLKSTFLSPGKYTKELEESIAHTHNKKYGLALNSGQSAIMIVLEAAKLLGKIKCVAVPAVTYISSVAAIIQAGLRVRMVDVQPDAHAEMKWDDIPVECDAILPCHLFGRANKIESQGRFVCEDACESIYAQGLGIGNAICLSFYPSHTITAGFGGMILTDDKELYFKCWQLINHGRQERDNYTSCHTLKERFTFSEWGYSLKFSDLNAAFGLAQHQQRHTILAERADNALALAFHLNDLIGNKIEIADLNKHTFMMFPIIVKGEERNELERALNDRNIETRRMMPLTTQPIIRDYFGAHICDTRYPGANFINDHGLYLGCHQNLTDDEIARIINTIKEFYA